MTIDMEALGKVLNNPEYKDHLVAIYSVAGPFRSGKSFLINLLLSRIRQNVSALYGKCFKLFVQLMRLILYRIIIVLIIGYCLVHAFKQLVLVALPGKGPKRLHSLPKA